MRLLDYLLAHQLVPDERTGRGLILRGDVLVDDKPQLSPAYDVAPGRQVRLRGKLTSDVSRGAGKLRPVLEASSFSPAGRICLDLGVADGGFTQVLLEHGAARVYAVDVAYGTVALAIRNDPRVVLLERTNARELTRELVPDALERVTGDLSFIGWATVLPAVRPLLATGAELLLLVKPQFELPAHAREQSLEQGVLRDPAVVKECLQSLYNVWVQHDLSPMAVYPAALKGARGNQEYFVHLAADVAVAGPEQYAAQVRAAMGGGAA